MDTDMPKYHRTTLWSSFIAPYHCQSLLFLALALAFAFTFTASL